MKMNIIVKRINVNKSFNFFFSQKNSCLYIKHFLGLSYCFSPSFFFWRQDLNSLKFIFIKGNFYKNFLTHFTVNLQKYLIYYVKIRIRGLGYRLRSIYINCHYFFFNYTNFYYFFNPDSLLIKTYKKRMLLISFDWCLLKVVLSHILLLRRLGPYTLHGLRFVKQIVYLKKRNKKL